MIIYGSSQWVAPSENKEWYQLSVISQWDWMTGAVCFKEISGHLISYCLYKNTVVDGTQAVSRTVPEITQEIRDELINMGYILSKNIK